MIETPLKTRLLVYSLFLISGATALVYQVTWVRNLSLIFGASFQAVSVVLASFMAGLAVGSFSFGRRSGRIRRPLRLYGLLEIGVAVFAFLLPTLLDWVDSIYVAAALRSDDVDFRLTLLRVAMAFGVLVIPTFFMGGTLPVLTRFLVHRHGEFGTRLAWLYGVNTLGAVGGALVAGFLLVPWLGVWHTQLTAVVVNLAVGVAAVMTDRRAPLAAAAEGAAEAAPSSRAVAGEPLEPVAKPPSTLPLRLAFWGTAVSGMCALAFEVLWTRGITLAVGSTTYSFTVMLAAFLVGIWLGSWLHAAVPLRRVNESLQFGLVLVAIGASGFAVSQMIPRLPELVVRLNLGIYGDLQRIRPGTTLLLAFTVMLVPCVLMGVAFPLAGQARARLKESFGQSVGDTLGLNTLGAIVGSLSAGFLLIPLLGLQRGMLLIAAIDIAYGVVVLGAFLTSRMERRSWLVWASGFGVVAFAFALPFLSPPWDANLMGGFNNNKLRKYVDARGQVDVPAAVAGGNVVYYREGRGSTVSVAEADNRSLLINGKAVASDLPSDVQHELLLGHVPVLLHSDPRSVLVVGLGAGVTAGAVAAHGAVAEIAVVEIEPAVVGGAAQFAHVNDHVLDDSRLEIAFQDGRNYLKTTRRKFDVITADPIHPWAYGAGYLYTTEYYQLASQRLNDGGVMCQWLPAYELSLANFKSVVGTFAESFAYATLWQASNDMVLIGSDAPIQVDIGALAERLEEPDVNRQLAAIGLENGLSFLAGFVMDSAGIENYAKGSILNTDDNLYLEFSSPLSIGAPQLRGNLRSIERYRANPIVVAANLSSMFASVAEAEKILRAYQRAKSRVVEAQLVRGTLRQSRDAARQPAVLQRVNGQMRSLVRRLPEFAPARIELAAGLAQLGAIQLASREPREAATTCQEAVELVPQNADCHRVLGLAMLQLGEYALAVEHLEAALSLQPRSWILYYQLSATLKAAGRDRDALEVVQEGLAIKPGHAGMESLLAHLRSVGASEDAP